MAVGPEMLTSGASGRVNALLSVRAWRAVVRVLTTVFLLMLRVFGYPKRAASEKVAEEKQTSVVRLPAAIVPRRVTMDQEVAVRRALAIRRVREDKDHRSARDYSLFVTPRGATLFTQTWTPFSKDIRAVLVLLHGLNEHSSRYSEFAKQLNGVGIKVYGMDWIGHGGSDGLHGYVHSLDDAVADLKALLDSAMSENPSLPCFCFAHSTGAAIVLKAALDPKIESHLSGIVVTSPAVGVKPSHPIFAVIAPIASYLLPRYQCQAANKSGTVVSRDPEALLAKYSDPLVYTGAIRVRTGCEILRVSAYLQQNLRRLRVPFLVLHGSSDAVTDPEGSKKLYEEASSTDKTIKLYEGLLHDILFEPERQTVTHDILEWLNERV